MGFEPIPMKTTELDGGRTRVLLNQFEYRQLVDSAESPTARLSIRLAGEVGLKVSEIVNVRLSHVQESDEAREVFFLHIPLTEDDESLEFARGRPRMAYLPETVHNAMYEYSKSNDISFDENLIQVTKRTTQYYFKRAGEEASSRTGIDEFELVTSSDVRIYFAKDAIERRHIHPNVVMEVGGWGEFDRLSEQLEDPDESLIIREFERAKHQDCQEGGRFMD